MPEQWIYFFVGLALVVLLALLFLFRRYFIPQSLRNRLPLAFMAIAGVTTALVVGAVIFQIYNTLVSQKGENAVALAQIYKNRLAEQIGAQVKLLKDLGTDYTIVNQVSAGRSVLDEPPPTERAAVFQARNQEWADSDSALHESIRLNPTSNALQYVMRNQTQFDQIIVTDNGGELAAYMGKEPDTYYYGNQAWWQEAQKGGLDNFYISPPYLEDGETAIIEIAVPLLPFSSEKILEDLKDEIAIQGILRARLRLTHLSLFSENLNQTYTTAQNAPEFALIHNNGDDWLFSFTSKTKIGQKVPPAIIKALANQAANWTHSTDETGRNIIRSHSKLISTPEQPYLDKLDITIIIEQSAPSFAQVYDFLPGVVGGSAIALIIASAAGILIAWQVIRPIQTLATTAQAISTGDLSQQVPVTSRDELGILANAFNSMTVQLRGFIDNLEQQVARRTRQIETVVEISQQLTRILDLPTLLREVVTITKETFNYYHVHIYLLQEESNILIMAEGYGQAGAKMKQQDHQIPLNAPTSLVARAARRREIVLVNDVRQAPDWLPNPLLPNTHCEMAVPIIAEGQVIGVLDVQSDKVAGLDKGDMDLLRSLANQIAVALTNAQLYQTERELRQAEAERAQELANLNADLKTAQAELLRQERLATLGQLTATVSHEIRNPLATIRASAFAIDRKVRGQGLDIELALDRIQRNITRCDNIIGELLDYTRMGDLRLQPILFDEWLKQVLDEQTVPDNITLRLDLTSGVNILLDSERFRRVIINLVDNAYQAMLEYGAMNDNPQILSIKSDIIDRHMRLSITDTGPGIPPDIMPHIFEPLYSTKGFGVGLGLPIVKEIVRLHAGKIEITSETGQGTQVTLWLPLPETGK